MKNSLWLILLGAFWGFSFLFMRMGVGAFGPIVLIFLRLSIAALFTTGVLLLLRKPLALKGLWRYFLVIATLNLAVPFLLFAYSAQVLTAGLLSIINATAPFFSAIFALIFLRTPMSVNSWIGLLVGFFGVLVLLLQGAGVKADNWWLSAFSALMAPVCYGLCSTYIRWAGKTVPPMVTTVSTLWIASILLSPLLFIAPIRHTPGHSDWLAVVSLGIMCTGLAYVIFYRLIDSIGMTRTLTVTFLVPFFGTLWGIIFLSEPVTMNLIIGGALILLGVAISNQMINLSASFAKLSSKLLSTSPPPQS